MGGKDRGRLATDPRETTPLTSSIVEESALLLVVDDDVIYIQALNSDEGNCGRIHYFDFFMLLADEGGSEHRRRAISVVSRVPIIGDWLRKLNDNGSPNHMGGILANYATLLLFLVHCVNQQERLAGVYRGI